MSSGFTFRYHVGQRKGIDDLSLSRTFIHCAALLAASVLVFFAGRFSVTCPGPGVETVEPPLAQGPFRPRPKPEPEPAPLDPDDSRLFARLRPHLLPLIRQHAQESSQAESQAASDYLDRMMAHDSLDAPVSGGDERVQGVFGAILGEKIAAFVKWAVLKIVQIVLLSILGALVWSYKWYILAGLGGLLASVWGIARVAGKTAK